MALNYKLSNLTQFILPICHTFPVTWFGEFDIVTRNVIQMIIMPVLLGFLLDNTLIWEEVASLSL